MLNEIEINNGGGPYYSNSFITGDRMIELIKEFAAKNNKDLGDVVIEFDARGFGDCYGCGIIKLWKS